MQSVLYISERELIFPLSFINFRFIFSVKIMMTDNRKTPCNCSNVFKGSKTLLMIAPQNYFDNLHQSP